MTTYNEDQFATRVLKDLGLVGAEETPSAADLAWAKETAATEILMLASIELPIWNGSEMEIPQEYLGVLSRRVGLAVAPSFGLIDIATAEQQMRAAEYNLTLLAAPRTMPLTLTANDATRHRPSFNYTTG